MFLTGLFFFYSFFGSFAIYNCSFKVWLFNSRVATPVGGNRGFSRGLRSSFAISFMENFAVKIFGTYLFIAKLQYFNGICNANFLL